MTRLAHKAGGLLLTAALAGSACGKSETKAQPMAPALTPQAAAVQPATARKPAPAGGAPTRYANLTPDQTTSAARPRAVPTQRPPAARAKIDELPLYLPPPPPSRPARLPLWKQRAKNY